MAVVSLIAFLVWAIVLRATGAALRAPNEQFLVGLTLVGQTGGFVLGFGFAWLWMAQAKERRFWKAIYWRKLSSPGVGVALLGGAALMVVVELLGHVIPMPDNAPMERLFTPHTAWMLAIYGVVIAPFFEEFFFRGLLYPTFRAAFQDGMQLDELRAWRPLVRVLGALGALTAVVLAARNYGLAAQTPGAGVVILFAAGIVVLVMPQWPIRGVGWIVNQIARLQRAEALAILLTGFLFGLMHAAQLGWAWGAVLILMFVGVILTAVRAASGSLIPSWLMHCAYNGTLFAAQFVATKGFQHFPH